MKALAPVTLSSSLCFWLLSVSSLCTLCFCNQNSNHAPCIATERLVLIQLKNNLIDHANRLSSWVGNDCCSWSGVVCNNITGNVQEIHLRGPDDGFHGHCHGPYDTDDELEEASKQMLGGTISPSVTKLLQLMYFDISCNDFGFIPIPAFFGSFQNLRYLNISKSQFSGEIAHQLGNLSKLRVLDLHDVPLAGNLHSKSLKWLKDLQELQYLDMGSIDLATALDWFQVISSLPSLLEIHCSLCGLIQLPSNPSTVSFTSLVVLDLSYNSFSDSLLPQWIFSLHNLVLLDLTNCFISGLNPGIRADFNSLPSLMTLSVSSNTFVNSSSLLNRLSSLSNIRWLDVSNCNISAPILGNLHNLSFIVHLDLSDNQIVEEIPKSLSNLCNLNTLDLQSNNFFGNVSELLERFCECESPKLKLLALRGNYVTGQLPEKLGRLKNLESIDLAYNQLTGSIPDSVGSLHLLKTLQMNINQLTGSIPDTIGGLSSLNFLDLSYNNLNGSFPESIGRLGELVFLTVHHNSLTENELVGRIPTSIGRENTSLKLLSLRSNKLEGKIPDEICHLSSIQIMDLAHNDLSGNLPTCFTNLTVISGREKSSPFILYDELFQNQVLGSASLVTKGRVSTYDNILYLVTTLDLSNNKFSGSIPDELVSLLGLRFLNLSKNNLTGQIPNSFSKTGMLESLDLSVNHLNGNIPSSLSSLTTLSFLDVSYNNLEGRIPTGPQLQTFNESSFIGNKLCGDPLPVCSPNTNDPRGTDDEHDESDGIDWILVIFTLVGLIIGFWIMIAPLIASKHWRNAYYHFLEGIWIKLQNSILIIFPCFRRRKPGHEVFSSIEQVQQFDLSQYIYDDKLKGFHPESSSSEASSSTQNIRHSDNKKA
ncbi:putative non-specific serine/threonine protein kinase [Helianthus debilis subsp. tardiflorus]